LVGDAERDDRMMFTRGPLAKFAEYIDCESRYLEWVVLDFTGCGEVLCEFSIGGVNLGSSAVEGDRSDAGRTRIEGEQEVHTCDDNQRGGPGECAPDRESPDGTRTSENC
jgi:hypothetical protein